MSASTVTYTRVNGKTGELETVSLRYGWGASCPGNHPSDRYVLRGGVRYCRDCDAERARAYRHKKQRRG